LTSTTNVQVKM